MAAELVGGALLSAFLQVAFDRLASPQVLDFFRGRKLDEKLLSNLKIMLRSIDALADDAELRQFTDPHIKAWLFDVKEAVFDAEDLLGEIDYELTRCQVEAQSQPQTFTYKVSNFFNPTFTSFNKKIESEMKEVLEKLQYLANQKGALGLKEGTYSGDGSGSKVPQKLPSSSLMAESVIIYGRDADKDIIINWLTSETHNPNHPSILSIVGMGGLGKTTLTQHVYNDPKIHDAKFDIKAWVCVSDHFNVLTVTRTILEAVTDNTHDSGNLEMVHKKLKEKLSGRKFLLVLDDVWNERPAEWEVVRTPLSYGAPGSRILVTTRGEKVASSMRSEVHFLKTLREDECWKVFENHALKDDLELNDEFMKVGRRIVEKCKGLPLALKTIGCLLHTKSSISDWKNILESDIWELPKEHSEIIPALFLSYRYLPSHLKRCFAYCALLPKDCGFVKEELILLWMAQNFLQCPQQIRHPEEVGEEYFNDLLSRSFFQQSGTRVSKMPMHFGELKNLQVLNPFFVDRNSELIPKQLGRLGGLNLHERLSINDLQNIFNPLDALKANVKDKHLVELELQWKSDHIPDDPRKEKEVLQNLEPSKHLEDLLITNYNGTEFPSWVFDNSLSNLVFLKLEGCKYCLCLPPLGLLSSLKTLKIKGLDGIVSIDAEFYGSNSSFASLESLTFSNMKEWEEWECKTISFPRLEWLRVDECPKLKGTHLKKVVVSDELTISGNSMNTLPFETRHTYGVCDSLTIFRLDFFPKLFSLQLTRCQNIRRISQEQEYAHNHLMYLSIDDCPKFKSFLFPKSMQILFPSLTRLHIVNCPEVELFPDGGLPLNIKHMSLSCFKLIASLRETLDPNPRLEHLSIKDLEVECFPDEVLLPRSLTSLIIWNCPNLKKMHYKGLCHLSSLTLVECPNLQCLPAEGLPKSISSLTIWDCPLLKERCRNPDGEDWEKIAHIQNLELDV
ncbi:hypothetical protein PHAVU_004G013100 [Phaseolus vulgaris]